MPQSAAEAPAIGSLYIREYRVQGAHKLSRIAVEEAVYPYLGPGRTPTDVEAARAALEKAYNDKGYQTVTVQVPPQRATSGVVVLQVIEAPVGRLRVRNSRYFLPSEIKREAPSLAEGQVPNFNDVSHDIVALNQLPDRRITPSLHAGVVPETVDVDLDVQDTFPLHGSLELNNRYSIGTTHLRLNGSVSYDNLWQLGHALGASFQIAPENLKDAEVFSGYYLARFPTLSWLALTVSGTKQDSNVSTLGGAAVAGRGDILGAQAIFTLPNGKDFYQTLALGIDYKHFDQNLLIAGQNLVTPITYYPASLNYSATWTGVKWLTVLNSSLTLAFRGAGSDEAEFDFNRYKSSGNFAYFRGDLGHTHELPANFQLSGKVQAQVSSQPLVSSEEFSGGGLATVRGYLESEVLGDDAVIGSFEFRTPSLVKGPILQNEWRIYTFAEGGTVVLEKPLPDQKSEFTLASVGVGTRVHLDQHFNGSLDLAFPLVTQVATEAFDPFLIFRVWAEF